jgi:agmatine/peptidylarginine deiminase
MNANQPQIIFPAEWQRQSGVLLTWPDAATDWNDQLEAVTACYVAIAREILKREKLLVVCRNKRDVTEALAPFDPANVVFREMPVNDTWARDHGAISVIADGKPYLYDFAFNGWGLKFAANHDNQITRNLYERNAFRPEVGYKNMMHCVLEGGSIENDGCGTLLTTSRCLLSPNRNAYRDLTEISDYLQLIFGAKRVLWLHHGLLQGDDTDGHIDTLARFCDPDTIAYVSCEDKNDAHYEDFSLMEKELSQFTAQQGKPYRLIPLPMADAVVFNGERLPATYANFLIINDAVLLPFYQSPKDAIARDRLQKAFPDRSIIGIDCLPLIRQHGSLHCVTMQFPEKFL